MENKMMFLFDLDATITKKEILPEIAEEINLFEEMNEMTKLAMENNIPFYESFSKRVELLRDISVETVQNLILNVPLNMEIVKFIRENKDRCIIVTGNIDVWIIKLMEYIGAEYACSKATIENDKIKKLDFVMDKAKFAESLNSKFIAIGDGSNDIEMFVKSEFGIAFGGVKNPSPGLLSVSKYAIYEEYKLCEFLRRLL